MKKINKSFFVILLILFGTIIFSSFSKPKSCTIKGAIHSYGSEPLNYPGITTNKGKEYLIVASEQTKKELLARQGKLIQITGIIIDDKDELPPFSLKDGAIKVEAWEVVQK